MADNPFQHSEVQPEQPSDEPVNGFAKDWQDLTASARIEQSRIHIDTSIGQAGNGSDVLPQIAIVGQAGQIIAASERQALTILPPVVGAQAPMQMPEAPIVPPSAVPIETPQQPEIPPQPRQPDALPKARDTGDQLSEYKIRWGDTLTGISSAILGRGASFREIRQMIRMLAAYNHIKNPNKIYAGRTLRLPPGYPMPEGATGHDHVSARHRIRYHERPAHYHTEHHSAEHHESHEHNHAEHDTPEPIPVPKVEPTHDSKPAPEPAHGPALEPNPNVEPSHDKKLPEHDAAPKPADKPEDHKLPDKSPELNPLDNSEVRYEHIKLIETAKHHNDAGEYRQFVHDMNQFEHSLGRLAESYRLKGKSEEETAKQIAGTIVHSYREVERIYETKAKNPQDNWQLDLDARTGMHNIAAAPEGNIFQGQHNTCAATATETMLAVKHPDKYMKMVADLAITGQHTGSDDKGVSRTVEIDNTPHGDSTLSIAKQDRLGKRNAASELVQTWIINADLQEKDPHLKWAYEEPSWGSPKRAGEFLLQDGKVIDNQPELSANDIARMYSVASGEPLRPIEIESSKACESDAICVGSQSAFEKVLQERKAEGEFWTPVAVQTKSKLLDQPNPGGHALLISDYYPGNKNHPSEIRYFNSWGKSYTDQVRYTSVMFDSLLIPESKH